MRNVRMNNLIRKIAIIILFIMCFNFLIPGGELMAKSWDVETSDDEQTPGGSLFQPIMDFLVFLADSVLNVLQHNFIATHDVVYSTNGGQGTFSGGWLVAALIGIVAIAYGIACIYTGGAAAALGTVIVGCLTTVGGGAVAAYSIGEFVDLVQGEFDIPFIMYHPYAIFSGGVPALDINFINPGRDIIRDQPTREDVLIDVLTDQQLSDFAEDFSIEEQGEAFNLSVNGSWLNPFQSNLNADAIEQFKENNNYDESNVIERIVSEDADSSFQVTLKETIYVWSNEEKVNIILKSDKTTNRMMAAPGQSAVDIEISYSFYQMEASEVLENYINETISENTTYYQSSAAILQSSIATWYKVLRRIALVGLLSVLVYVGIRIIISSTAADMAKYKKMFLDWLVAVCLLFVLHYIMILVLTVSTNLTGIFQTAGAADLNYPLPENTELNGTKLTEMTNLEQLDSSQYGDIRIEEQNGVRCPVWYGEFVGYIRLKAGASWVRHQMAYGLIYLVLVIDICMFTFMYLKRVLYMAFLTMIAPLIALTYPLDKIKDGQAQAFGLWLREYIFNALIQPVHLIIYTMVISTVIDLVTDHPVYALVALGFMLPAEKFIRNMFGFQKASTVDALGSAFGGAALMGAVSKLSKLGKKKGDKKEEKGKDTIRTADRNINMPDITGEALGGRSAIRTSRGQQHNEEQSGAQITRGNTLQGENEQQDNTSQEVRTQQRATSQETSAQQQEATSQTVRTAEQGGNSQQGENSETPIRRNSENSRQNNNKPQISRMNRMRNAMMSMGNKAGNKIIKSKPLRTVGKFTAMGIGAATLGTVGLAAGISTGDMGSVMKYTGAGMGVGAALGKSAGESAMDKASEVKENFKEGYMGSEAYNNEKLDREYFTGQGYQEMLDNHNLMPHLSGAERANALRSEIEQYRSYGFTDNKQIESCMRAGLSVDAGAHALQISSYLKGKNIDSAGLKAYEDDYRRSLAGRFDNNTLDNIWNVIKANM